MNLFTILISFKLVAIPTANASSLNLFFTTDYLIIHKFVQSKIF